MIFVDDRAGSKELIAPLRALGLEVESTRLDFGDVMFEGRGVKSAPVSVGIEFKQLRELVQALRTERLQGHQLIGMRQAYDHAWLFIEGELLYDAKGRLLRRKGKRETVPLEGSMTVVELLKRMFVLHLCGGLNPWWSQTRQDTLQGLLTLYRTWTDQDLDKHRSHLGIYSAPTLVPVSDFRATVKQFPGVGIRLSKAVEDHFGSLRKAVNAGVEEWAELTTKDDQGKSRKFGKTAAERVVRFCRGED